MSQRRTIALLLVLSSGLKAEQSVDVWPGLAPGETTRSLGEVLPFREDEKPHVTRIVKISRPTFQVFRAAEPNGIGVVILPGGGFGKVVPDKEGSEAARWLNKLGIGAFVLNYRTTEGRNVVGWRAPLQDAQRTMSLVRSRVKEFGLKPDRIGLLGFSAGGQVAARLLTDGGKLSYDRIDKIDAVSHRPDFSLLIYPWKIYDAERAALHEEIQVSMNCPPTFLVHTDDDPSSSLGAVHFYAGLKTLGIPSELHVYGNGGHGYGLRSVTGSQISTWPGHAEHWLSRRGLTD